MEFQLMRTLKNFLFTSSGKNAEAKNGGLHSPLLRHRERDSSLRGVGERILLFFSNDPNRHDPARNSSDPEPLNRLEQLAKAFPDFIESIYDKEILDFGCGSGYQSFAMAEAGARRVLGIDLDLTSICWPEEGFDRSKVDFKHEAAREDRGRYDIVISQNSMEHFSDPEKILKIMLDALKPDGKLLITFGPPWYAPYGSHMKFFTGIPWVNLLFPEKTVMTVRKLFRQDGAMRYVDVESGLNKMTVGKFERLLRDSSLKVEYRSYECVKGLDFLGAVPYVRELFVNQISVIVSRQNSHASALNNINTGRDGGFDSLTQTSNYAEARR